MSLLKGNYWEQYNVVANSTNLLINNYQQGHNIVANRYLSTTTHIIANRYIFATTLCHC